jgi:hypothetical protein
MRLAKTLSEAKPLKLHIKTDMFRACSSGGSATGRLISNPQIYLTDFEKRTFAGEFAICGGFCGGEIIKSAPVYLRGINHGAFLQGPDDCFLTGKDSGSPNWMQRPRFTGAARSFEGWY